VYYITLIITQKWKKMTFLNLYIIKKNNKIMNFIVDSAKALKKWSPVLESLNVNDSERSAWMAEYAELHQMNENVAYSTLGNNFGMGGINAPQPHAIPGNITDAQPGSGDVAQNLLPVSMKIAAQTIGLDLVAVKPASSPRIELLFVDFKYDNNPEGHNDFENADERPLVFKVVMDDLTPLKTEIYAAMTANSIIESIGGINKRLFYNFTSGTYTVDYSVVEPDKAGWLEFLGFSRVDGKPMYRTFRQMAAGSNVANFEYIATRNTFVAGTDSSLDQIISGGTTISAVTALELVSTMEDQLPGFSANWNLNAPMDRLQDENTYPGIIAPDVFSKSVQVGDIEISSTLKRTQIEDIKAATGMDIVQKLESVLINELTQTISKQIVLKIQELGEKNKASHTAPKDAVGNSKFDFDVDAYTNVTGSAPGGETYHSIQRKLVAKINNASNFIATDGRVGPAQYLVTNGNIASILQDVAGYTINPANMSKMNTNGQLYPMGNIGNISIYVDPYMLWDDNRIFLGRKNSVEQPGLVFVPYLMAQSISLISEATWAPRMLIRSRYTIADIGFFPWKQFMAIKVTDNNGVLI
jgi:hypothetical protein